MAFETARLNTNLVRDAVAGLMSEPDTVGDLAKLAARNADPAFWFDVQRKLFSSQFSLMCQALVPSSDNDGTTSPDRRFSAPEWDASPWFRWLRDSYLSNSRIVLDALADADLEIEQRERLGFYLRIAIESLSPANFATTNPEAQKEAFKSNGVSAVRGAWHVVEDLQKGYISLTDESAFELGKNIAATPGQVVYENDVIQLIQYAPLTEKVHTTPLLIVPPFVNKFYIMDLEPENSFVRWAVEQGHSVFLVSFVNPGSAESHLTWDDYVEDGYLAALQTVSEITGQPDANVLAFCTGGTLAVTAFAPLIARGEECRVKSLTLLTTGLEFSDVGDIGVYMDSPFMRSRARSLKDGGILPARDLNAAFSALKADDLVWANVTNRYLKGMPHSPFGLLYWNSDPTGLPGPMYSWYLEHAYLGNKLVQPGETIVCGAPLDLSKISVPVYAMAAFDDHIVPWKGAYDSARQLGNNTRFCLGAGGHIAGTMNPASKNRRHYWTSDTPPSSEANTWLKEAEKKSGSWWLDWNEWIQKHTGCTKNPRKKMGSRAHKPIEPAPGRYVVARS